MMAYYLNITGRHLQQQRRLIQGVNHDAAGGGERRQKVIKTHFRGFIGRW